MDSTQDGDTTRLLLEWGQGDRQALDRLMAVLYPALHRRAEASLRGEREGHTLQPTALVNEVYLRIVDVDRIDWKGRAHFLGVASRLMRQIVVDSARRHRAAKRGGGRTVSLTQIAVGTAEEPVDVFDLDRALTDLAALDAQKSRIVELRFFGGATIDEAAEVLDVSARTVKRGWQAARTWLYRELRKAHGAQDSRAG